MKRHSQRIGLTLTELLVVISIIVIVTGVMVPMMQTVSKGQPVNEASRVVSAYFADAQTKAISKNKSYGVWLQRAIAESGQPNDAFTVFKLFQAEQPSPYSGDFNDVHLKISTAAESQPNCVALASQIPGINGTNVDRVRFAYALLPQLASAERLIQRGDEIRFDYRDPWYPILDVPKQLDYNGLKLLVFAFWDVNGTTNKYLGPGSFTSLRSLPFQILRQPRKTTEPPLEMPRGTAIDLSLSGLSGELLPRFRYSSILGLPDICSEFDIVIMFGSDGQLDRLYYQYNNLPITPYCETLANNSVLPIKKTVIGAVQLLVGQEEKIGLDGAGQPQIITSMANIPPTFGDANLRETTNVWLTISGDRISTAPNAGVSVPVQDGAVPLDEKNFPTEVRSSRRFTTSGLSMGSN